MCHNSCNGFLFAIAAWLILRNSSDGDDCDFGQRGRITDCGCGQRDRSADCGCGGVDRIRVVDGNRQGGCGCGCGN